MPLNILDAQFRSFAQQVVPKLVAQGVGVLPMKPMASGVIPQNKVAFFIAHGRPVDFRIDVFQSDFHAGEQGAGRISEGAVHVAPSNALRLSQPQQLGYSVSGGIMHRRQFLQGMAAVPAAAAQQYERRTRGLPRLTIKAAYPIVVSPAGRYQWVFVKVITSEPGLYGLGSASNHHQALTVAAAIEKHLAPFWVGRDVDRIDDIWYATAFRSYRRSDTVFARKRRNACPWFP
jgi:Mandelate racemase / muconate lactonizing enzyme, N-terminal domain